MRKFLFLVSLILLIGMVSAIPQTLSVQGRLTNSSGTALTGNYNILFSLYTIEMGGTSFYNSIQSITTDTNGIYHVVLKDINNTFSSQYYLGITVGADAEMAPRINITSSAYAFRANETDYLNQANNYEIQNLTLAQTLTFAFGEMIDNIVDEWLRITGNLNVTGNVSAQYYTGDGSLLSNLPATTMNYANVSLLNQSVNWTDYNVSALYFIGDGSQLTGIVGGGEPLFLAENTTIWNRINALITENISIWSNIRSLNDSLLNLNTTFYAENTSLWVGIGDLRTENISLWNTITSSNVSWLSTFNASYDALLNDNASLWSTITSSNASWLSTFNASYDAKIEGSGTQYYLPIWGATNDLSNSLIYQYQNENITINQGRLFVNHSGSMAVLGKTQVVIDSALWLLENTRDISETNYRIKGSGENTLINTETGNISLRTSNTNLIADFYNLGIKFYKDLDISSNTVTANTLTDGVCSITGGALSAGCIVPTANATQYNLALALNNSNTTTWTTIVNSNASWLSTANATQWNLALALNNSNLTSWNLIQALNNSNTSVWTNLNTWIGNASNVPIWNTWAGNSSNVNVWNTWIGNSSIITALQNDNSSLWTFTLALNNSNTTIWDTITNSNVTWSSYGHNHSFNNLTAGNMNVNINMTSKNITDSGYIKLASIGNVPCDIVTSGAICKNDSGLYIIG